MYRIHFLDSALADLKRLDKPIAQRITKRLKWLAANLENIRLEPLKGDLSNFNKFRVGDYRILYEVIQSEEMIIIHQIGHRREIYRR